MSFESFDDMARAGLKRMTLPPSRIAIKTEVGRTRPQTIFRFADDLVQQAGWSPGSDRIGLFIHRGNRTIEARRVGAAQGYKLLGGHSSRPHVKFTVAAGMPVADTPGEATDVVVQDGVIMFVLPDGIHLHK
jgi:hypothetical protein